MRAAARRISFQKNPLRNDSSQKTVLFASAAVLALIALGGCAPRPQSHQAGMAESAPAKVAPAPAKGAAIDTGTATKAPASASSGNPQDEAIAIFAGGCFWCMEPPFDKLPGVISTTSGYTGGHTKNPTYELTSAGGTGHTEAMQVRYDPGKVSYETLLDVFWHNIDPFAVDRQFCDGGDQYRSGIFPANVEQRRLAEASKQKFAARFGRSIATEITDATTFYPAEEYHQDYYSKNAVRYKFYRYNCGRDARLEEIWGQKG